jgi:hypothetical protein
MSITLDSSSFPIDAWQEQDLTHILLGALERRIVPELIVTKTRFFTIGLDGRITVSKVPG